MQAVKGFLSDGYFTPNENIHLPNYSEVVLIFADVVQSQSMPERNNEYDFNSWFGQIDELLSLSHDEDLSDFPKQAPMRVDYEDWVN